MTTDDEPRTTETEVAHAREELREGDVADALRHLAVALSFDPSHAEALEMLDQALDAAGERALDLLRVEEGTFFGLAALRAHALARRGRRLEALVILFEVASFRPEIPWLVWSRRWFANADGGEHGDGFTPDDVAARAVAFVEPLGGEILDHEGVRRNLEGTLFALDKLRARHPEVERLTYAAILVLRRLGRHDEAIALARQWFDAKPSWISAVSAANAYRDHDDVDGAVPYYRRALELRPGDLSPLLDIGDLFLESGRHGEAAEAYAQALAKRPHDPWAEPSHAFARYLATRQERWRDELEALAARAPQESRARELVARLPGTS